jgi:hypothetical protein
MIANIYLLESSWIFWKEMLKLKICFDRIVITEIEKGGFR